MNRFCHSCGSSDVKTRSSMANGAVNVVCNECGAKDTRNSFDP